MLNQNLRRLLGVITSRQKEHETALLDAEQRLKDVKAKHRRETVELLSDLARTVMEENSDALRKQIVSHLYWDLRVKPGVIGEAFGEHQNRIKSMAGSRVEKVKCSDCGACIRRVRGGRLEAMTRAEHFGRCDECYGALEAANTAQWEKTSEASRLEAEAYCREHGHVWSAETTLQDPVSLKFVCSRWCGATMTRELK